MRFPFFFSLPLLAYARLRGYSWYEVTGGVRHGYWDFRRSWLMRKVFPWILLLDAFLAGLWNIYLPLWRGWTVVCERFVLDMLADLAVAFGEERCDTKLPGRLFVRLIPADFKVVMMDLDRAAIIQRRANLGNDRSLAARLNAFQALGSGLEIPMLSSMPPISQVNRMVWEKLGTKMNSIDKKAPHYGNFCSPWLRNVLSYPAVAVGLHWTFQSLIYMKQTERWLRSAWIC